MNDKELVEMLSKEVDAELIEFAGMTYRDQVVDINLSSSSLACPVIWGRRYS